MDDNPNPRMEKHSLSQNGYGTCGLISYIKGLVFTKIINVAVCPDVAGCNGVLLSGNIDEPSVDYVETADYVDNGTVSCVVVSVFMHVHNG